MAILEQPTALHRRLWTVPDIETQAMNLGCEAGIFDFGKAMNSETDYFNAGVIQRNDGLWLVTRRARWNTKDKMGYNDIVAFSINPDNLRPHRGFEVKMGKQWATEHFEDPRAYYVNGRTFVSACNFVRNPRGMVFPHQVITEVDSNWQLVKRYDPVYGNNGSDTGNNVKHEKNWTWIWEDSPLMLYHLHPLTIVRFDDQFRSAIEICKINWNPETVWIYGEPRGGSPAHSVNGLYFVFFHSSTPFNSQRRQYHMGCLAFDDATYEPVLCTTEPLLTGSTHNYWSREKPPCIFTCGALYQNNEWLITGGSNDLQCFWFKISHTKLLEQMIEL